MSTLSTPSSAATVAATPATLDYTSLPVSEDPSRPVFGGLSAVAWIKIIVVSALLIALFRFNLARLWLKTNPVTGDANWGHTPGIPLLGLYFLYLNRDRLLSAKVKPILFERFTRMRLITAGVAVAVGLLVRFAVGPMFRHASDVVGDIVASSGYAAIAWGVFILLLGSGLGNLLFGLLVFAYGIYPGQNDWIKDYGMVHTIFGTVLTLCGWEVMAVVWFPIAFLLCGVPWPGQVYSYVASPLQRLAAIVAVKMLNITGIDSVRYGTKMFITNAQGFPREMNVAEACAGMRSLMTFISVAAAVAFLSSRAFWQKVVITLSAVPIAVFCNVMRITVQAYLDRLAGTKWSDGFAHAFVGLVMLIPAFFLILLVAWVLDKLFIEEADERARIEAANVAKRAAGATPKAVEKPAQTEKKVIVVQPKKPAPALAAAAPAPAAPAVAKTQAAPVPSAPKAAPAPAAPAPAPAAPARPAAPVRPAAPPPARMPPRTNLTGNRAPARPAAPPPPAPPAPPAPRKQEGK